MDWKVQTSSSNSDFGNREKKETKFIVGNLGKVALRSNEKIFFEKNTRRNLNTKLAKFTTLRALQIYSIKQAIGKINK